MVPRKKSCYNLVHPMVLFLLEVGDRGGAGVDCLTCIKKFQVLFSQIFFPKLLKDE